MRTPEPTLLEVVVNRNGHPKQVFKRVSSIMEIADEENERLKAISFYCNNHWHDIQADEFDRITIEKVRA